MQFVHDDPGFVVCISGRIGGSDLPDLRQALLFAIELGTGDLVLDIDGVSVAEVTVLGLMIEGHRRAERAGRRLVLHNVPPDLDRLLRRTKLGRMLYREESQARLPLTQQQPA